jgi:hypothetical protein
MVLKNYAAAMLGASVVPSERAVDPSNTVPRIMAL